MSTARDVDAAPSAAEPFLEWQRAVWALKAAEFRGAEHAEIVWFRRGDPHPNAMTIERLQAGWQPPDDILKHLSADEQLLREQDDTEQP